MIAESLETRRVLAATVYVDGAFSILSPGDPIVDADPLKPGDQGAVFGTDAFSSIQDGIQGTDVGGRLLVNEGIYAESVFIASPITIEGNSSDPTNVRIQPPSEVSSNGITVGAGGDDVTISYLTVDGATGHGITAIGVTGLSFQANLINNGGDGFFGSQLGGNFSVGSSRLINNQGTGIRITDSASLDADLDSTTVQENRVGVQIDEVGELAVVENETSRNRNGGWWVSDVATDVTFDRVSIRDNDNDHDGNGSGITIVDGSDPDSLSVGGKIRFFESDIRDSDGAGTLRNQARGVDISQANEVYFEEEHGGMKTEIRGHQLEGLRVVDSALVRIINGTFSGNRSGSGIRINNVSTISASSFDATNNGAFGVDVSNASSLSLSANRLQNNLQGAGNVDNVQAVELLESGNSFSVSDSVFSNRSSTPRDFLLTSVDSIKLTTYTAEDEVHVTPSATMEIEVIGNAPNSVPGDRLIVDAGGQPYVGTPSSVAVGSLLPIHFSQFEHVRVENSVDGIIGGADGDNRFEIAPLGDGDSGELIITTVGSISGDVTSVHWDIPGDQIPTLVGGPGNDSLDVYGQSGHDHLDVGDAGVHLNDKLVRWSDIDELYVDLGGGNNSSSFGVVMEQAPEKVELVQPTGGTTRVELRLESDVVHPRVTLFDVSGREEPLVAPRTLIEGLGAIAEIRLSDILSLEILSDGNDDVTFAIPQAAVESDPLSGPTETLRLGRNAAGSDFIAGADNGRPAISWSGLADVAFESIDGFGGLEIDLSDLSGAASYSANLQQTDVVSLLGSNTLDDHLVIGRYGNAWHAEGIRLMSGGPDFRAAGFGALHIHGGGGDDVVSIDVEESRGSDLIPIPIFVDGGVGGFDSLVVLGEPPTPIETAEYRPGPDTHNGRLRFLDGDALPTMDIEFSGLEPVFVQSSVKQHTVRGSDGSERFAYYQLGPNGVVHVNDKESYHFGIQGNTPVALALHGEKGNDHFDLDLADPLGFSQLDVIEIFGDFAIDQPLVENQVVIRGRDVDEVYRYEYNDPNSGSRHRDQLEIDRTVGNQTKTTYLRMSEIAAVTLVESGNDRLELVGSSADERLSLQLLTDGTHNQTSPRRHAVQFHATEPETTTAAFTLTAHAMASVSADLGDGIDQIDVIGGTGDDFIAVSNSQIHLLDGSPLFPIPPVTVSQHEGVSVHGGDGDDRITLTEPTSLNVTVHGEHGDDRLVMRGRSASLRVAPLAGERDGTIQSSETLSRSTNELTYFDIDTLELQLENSDPYIEIVGDGDDNEITVTHPGLPVVQIDDRTTVELHGLGGDAHLKVRGLEGHDRFHASIGTTNLRLDGGEGGNALFIESTGVAYEPLGTTARGGRFTTALATLTAGHFDAIELEASDVVAAANGRLPSRDYRLPAPRSVQARAFAYITPRIDGQIPLGRILGPDGEVIVEDLGGQFTEHSGVLVARGLDINDSHLFFQVQCPAGEHIPDFELFGGVIEPEEFQQQDEPNNDLVQATVLPFGAHHRVATEGTLPIGDVDVIAININNSHRIAAILDNDPSMGGQPLPSILEILGPDGQTLLATGSNLQGEQGNAAVTPPLPAGQYFVRISRSAAEASENYELLVMEVSADRSVTDGLSPVDFRGRAQRLGNDGFAEVEPNNTPGDDVLVNILANGSFRQQGSVPFGDSDLVAININNSHRIAAVVSNDPLLTGVPTPTVLEILSPDGETPIARGGNVLGDNWNELVTPPLDPGTYYVRVSNPVTDSPVNYELTVFHVADEAVFANREDGDGSAFARDLLPGEHVDGSVPPSDWTDDHVQYTPSGTGEAFVRFNLATPLSLRNATNLAIDGRDGTDTLEVIATDDSDDLIIETALLVFNDRVAEYEHFERIDFLGRSGNDNVLIESAANMLFVIDGGDGDDRLAVQSIGDPLHVSLPNRVVDSRTIDSEAIESIRIDALNATTDVLIDGTTSPSGVLDVIPQKFDRIAVQAPSTYLEINSTGPVAFSAATPPAADAGPIRTIQVRATAFDDIIAASATSVSFTQGPRGFDLSGIPSIRIDADDGLDTIRVEPSSFTRFFVDGGNPSGFGDKLELLTSATTQLWPGPENDEGAFQIDGAQPVSFDRIEHTQVGSTPADWVIDLDGTSNIPVPDPQLINEIEVLLDGANLLIRDTAGPFSHSAPLHAIGSLRIRGAANRGTTVVVDYRGGAFSIPGGIHVDGGVHVDDQLILFGTGISEAEHRTLVTPAGPPKVTLRDGSTALDIRYENMEVFRVGNVNRFGAIGLLDIGGNTFSVDSHLPVDLGGMTVIAGGLLESTRSLILESNEALVGSGTVNAPVSGDVGSSIRATGDLSLGTSSSPIGFTTRGEMVLGANTLTLNDSNEIVLGSLTEIGIPGSAGRLNAANGILVDFGNNVTGFGTIDSPNDVNRRVLNNGDIRGFSGSEQLTLNGFVKGVGTVANVTFAGTHSPGLSPAAVHYGNLRTAASSTMLLEIAGRVPGSQGHDQVNSTGSITVEGTIDIQWIDGFEPQLGDEFVLMNSDAGIFGSDLNVHLPELPEHLVAAVNHTENQLSLKIESNAPRVTSVLLESGAASNRDRLGLSINGAIEIIDDPFTLEHRETGQRADIQFTSQTDGANTLVELSFQGPLTRGSSNALIDGNYLLRIDWSKIVRLGTAVGLDGNGDGIAGDDFLFGESQLDAFFALFGDADGNRVVDGNDFAKFGNAFLQMPSDPRFDPIFDFDGDGDVDGLDYRQFQNRLSNRLPF